MPPPRTRVALVVAVGVLLLDAILLITAGLWDDRIGLVAGGVASGVVALVLLLLWRSHQRRVAEIDVARRDLRQQVAELSKLTGKPR